VNDAGLPEVPKQKPPEMLATLALNLIHELLKVGVLTTGDPSLVAAVDSGGGAIKAAIEYWRARQYNTGTEFLKHAREMLLRHDEILEKLKKKESPEPFANLFTTILHSAMNDDEEVKAKFYAAFLAGFGPRDVTPSKQVMLLDAMRRLRAHELYVLLLFARAIQQFPGLAIMQHFNGNPTFNIALLDPPKGSPQAELLAFELTGPAIGALAAAGLLVQQAQGGVVGGMGGAGNIAYHMGPHGSLLSTMLLENLEDIAPTAVPQRRPGDLENR
jgi:hypothetical protein